jgi:hypothetical protein
MHLFNHGNSARKRAVQEKKQQVTNLQDAQDLIAELTEQNAALMEQVADLQQALNDVQEVAAGLLEK